MSIDKKLQEKLNGLERAYLDSENDIYAFEAVLHLIVPLSKQGYNPNWILKFLSHKYDENLEKSIERLLIGCAVSVFSMNDYINDNLRALREFLNWLERQHGYKKINYNHIEYLNLSNNQRNTAKATEYKKSYKYEEIFKTIRLMPEKTIIERRNKAIISLQALCGLRISELRTVKMKSFICEDGIWFIDVNPKYMVVKFAKQRQANFMKLPDDILQNVLDWLTFLTSLDFKGLDPFFPQFENQFNQSNLLENKITHTGIKSNTTIRDIFKKAFTTAGYAYLRPHSLRHTMVRFAEKQSPEFLNAVRQALGHSSIDTTFQSYGQLSERERIAGLVYDFT